MSNTRNLTPTYHVRKGASKHGTVEKQRRGGYYAKQGRQAGTLQLVIPRVVKIHSGCSGATLNSSLTLQKARSDVIFQPEERAKEGRKER